MAARAEDLVESSEGRHDHTDREKREAVLVCTELGVRRAAEITGYEVHSLVAWTQQFGRVAREDVRPWNTAGWETLRGRMKERQMLLAHGLMTDAERLRDQLFAPTQTHTFTKDGTFVTGDLPEPTFRDKQSILTSIAIIVDKVQLVMGDATVRIENLGEVTKEQALDALDEIKRRRDHLRPGGAEAGGTQPAAPRTPALPATAGTASG